MDHLFHKNILQEKHNLEWQLAEANAKIEQLKRTISSLQEKKQTIPTWKPYKNAPGYPEPVQGKDGRWYSPNPKPESDEPAIDYPEGEEPEFPHVQPGDIAPSHPERG
jgi:hypothetical protein